MRVVRIAYDYSAQSSAEVYLGAQTIWGEE